jgi:hypothetical protein
MALDDNRMLSQSGLFFLDHLSQRYLIRFESSISHQTDFITFVAQAIGYLGYFPVLLGDSSFFLCVFRLEQLSRIPFLIWKHKKCAELS